MNRKHIDLLKKNNFFLKSKSLSTIITAGMKNLVTSFRSTIPESGVNAILALISDGLNFFLF